MSPPSKILSLPPFLPVSPSPSLDRRPHTGQKVSTIAVRQILLTILLAVRIFSFTMMTYLKELIGIESLNTKQSPAELFPRISPPVSPPYLK